MSQSTRVSAYAVCRMDDELLLVHQVAPGPASGLWTLPGGGVDFGEHPRTTVVREVHEETGCTAYVGDLLDVHDNIYDLGDGVQRHGIRLLFSATVSGLPQPGRGGEIDEVGWFRYGELPVTVTPWAVLASTLGR